MQMSPQALFNLGEGEEDGEEDEEEARLPESDRQKTEGEMEGDRRGIGGGGKACRGA